MIPKSFDFSAAAELYTFNRRRGQPRGLAFRRFETAASAIRYSIEELPSASFPGTMMEVNEVRYRHTEIRTLYDSASFPLKKQVRKENNAEKAELQV